MTTLFGTSDLLARGWTIHDIRLHLPEPDRRWSRGWYCRNLYDISRVYAAESTPRLSPA